ncbi:hypothetical protein Pcinc_005561 [Petrolisthes cinctipes]|uniref:Uncharacterized protein n=1 Tax=Petrolisthes cinctipes TaxID=88211 RepID=A0AAE1KYY8_PETCI|nr:hypothetical protein Pcinc_005561 [Petrolisthes cinctipes]
MPLIQVELNDLTRDLNLSKESAQLLGSRIREKCLLAPETTFYWYRDPAESDQDWKAIAKANNIPIQTAYGWIRRAGEQRKKRGGRRFTKVREEHVEMIVDYVQENPLVTLKEIAVSSNSADSTSAERAWLMYEDYCRQELEINNNAIQYDRLQRFHSYIVYRTKIRDINDLQQRITDAIATIDEAML